jgi:hypothetical protein
MKDIREALAGFWGGFGLPAHPAGFVPRGENFPYITYDVLKPGHMDSGVLTVNVWDRCTANCGWFGNVDEIAERIAEAIPAVSGVVLHAENVKIWLYRANPFIRFLDEPGDKAVVRAIIRVIVKVFST